MSCYSPLAAVLVLRGKRRSISFDRKALGQGISLPCGRCIGCRLERARQWATRLVHEAKMHGESSFITLTYDEKSLPRVSGKPTLSKDDCQLFMKRLRKELEPKRIRFFLCGEYGEKMGRPHYHAIIFGEGFSDKKPLLGQSGEFTRWTSETLTRVWGKGRTEGGDVSFDSAMYVANYATKKITGKDAKLHYSGRVPEFLLMSRKPGIGRKWIDAYIAEVYATDSVVVRGFPTRPPRYYDGVLGANCPEVLAGVKVRRESAAAALEDMVLQSGVIVSVAPSRNARRLQVRETVARAKLALKRRNLENER